MKATLTLKGGQKRPEVPKKRPQSEKSDQNLALLKKVTQKGHFSTSPSIIKSDSHFNTRKGALLEDPEHCT